MLLLLLFTVAIPVGAASTEEEPQRKPDASVAEIIRNQLPKSIRKSLQNATTLDLTDVPIIAHVERMPYENAADILESGKSMLDGFQYKIGRYIVLDSEPYALDATWEGDTAYAYVGARFTKTLPSYIAYIMEMSDTLILDQKTCHLQGVTVMGRSIQGGYAVFLQTDQGVWVQYFGMDNEQMLFTETEFLQHMSAYVELFKVYHETNPDEGYYFGLPLCFYEYLKNPEGAQEAMDAWRAKIIQIQKEEKAATIRPWIWGGAVLLLLTGEIAVGLILYHKRTKRSLAKKHLLLSGNILLILLGTVAVSWNLIALHLNPDISRSYWGTGILSALPFALALVGLDLVCLILWRRRRLLYPQETPTAIRTALPRWLLSALLIGSNTFAMCVTAVNYTFNYGILYWDPKRYIYLWYSPVMALWASLPFWILVLILDFVCLVGWLLYRLISRTRRSPSKEETA